MQQALSMGVVQSAGDSGDDGDSKFGRQGCGVALSQQWATSMGEAYVPEEREK